MPQEKGFCSNSGEFSGPVPTVQDIQSNSKSAKEAREMLYGPGGVFGPKGPFSTPAVRYPGGLEVTPAPATAQSGHQQAKRPLSNSEMSSVGAEDMRSCKSQLVTNSVRQMGSAATSGAGESKPPSRMDQYRASSRGPPAVVPKAGFIFERKKRN